MTHPLSLSLTSPLFLSCPLVARDGRLARAQRATMRAGQARGGLTGEIWFSRAPPSRQATDRVSSVLVWRAQSQAWHGHLC